MRATKSNNTERVQLLLHKGANMGAADEVFPALDRIVHAARMSLLFVEKFSIDI